MAGNPDRVSDSQLESIPAIPHISNAQPRVDFRFAPIATQAASNNLERHKWYRHALAAQRHFFRILSHVVGSAYQKQNPLMPPTWRTNGSTTCPACGGEAVPYCEKSGYDRTWNISRCVGCRHGFVGNRPTPDFLHHVYAQTTDHVPTQADSPAEANRDAASFAHRIAAFTNRPGFSLDIGSGSAVFSYHLSKFGFSPVMIDLDPRAEQCAKAIERGAFHLTDFESFETETRFKAILMSQVLEHALEPAHWLRRAASLLDEDGVLAVALPNFSGIYRLLGRRDPFLCPPIHLNFFTAKSLTLMLHEAGLAPLHVETVSLVSVSQSRGVTRRVCGHLWNSLAAPIVSLGGNGIILRLFASKKSDASHDPVSVANGGHR